MDKNRGEDIVSGLCVGYHVTNHTMIILNWSVLNICAVIRFKWKSFVTFFMIVNINSNLDFISKIQLTGLWNICIPSI